MMPMRRATARGPAGDTGRGTGRGTGTDTPVPGADRPGPAP